MDALVTVRAMRERYGCSNPTARKYLRQVVPHMENPLAAPEWAVREWEDGRTVVPAGKVELLKRREGRTIVPRHR